MADSNKNQDSGYILASLISNRDGLNEIIAKIKSLQKTDEVPQETIERINTIGQCVKNCAWHLENHQ